MGRQRLQCRLCSAGHAAFALLALALPSIIHAARLPASEAQVPFVLSQQQQATGSYGLWQQYSPTGEAGSPSDQLKTMNRYQDEAVARIRLDGLDDGEVTHILQELEVSFIYLDQLSNCSPALRALFRLRNLMYGSGGKTSTSMFGSRLASSRRPCMTNFKTVHPLSCLLYKSSSIKKHSPNRLHGRISLSKAMHHS